MEVSDSWHRFQILVLPDVLMTNMCSLDKDRQSHMLFSRPCRGYGDGLVRLQESSEQAFLSLMDGDQEASPLCNWSRFSWETSGGEHRARALAAEGEHQSWKPCRLRGPESGGAIRTDPGMSRRWRQEGEKLSNVWEGKPAAPEPGCLTDLEAVSLCALGGAMLLGPLLV